MAEIRICQSCGMPLEKEEDYGTESGGGRSKLYCRYCYLEGKFTEPDITLDEMSEKGAGIMAAMYEMPHEKALEFAKGQLTVLKRWSGMEVEYCESCGMPILDPEDLGTEADGTKNARYCYHCYRHGRFTEPDLTREQMIEKYAPMLARDFGMPIEKARLMVERFTSTLPRWRE